MSIAVLLTLLGCAASGWLVGRLHRRHQAPMIFAYVGSALLLAMVQLTIQIRLIGWTIRPVVQYPQTLVLFFVLVPVSILMGGLMAGPGLDASGQSRPAAAATTAGQVTRDEDS